MTRYNSYAEAKIANPDCEIFITDNGFIPVNGEFANSWVIANSADYCSTLKEFLGAGFKLVEGDKYLEVVGCVYIVKAEDFYLVNEESSEDCNRYILSAAALNGGCKIPDKAEQWTIYSNVTPMCELTDEQYGKMRRAHDSGSLVEFANVTNGFEFEVIDNPRWCKDQVYRIKPKSERELFIEASVQLMTSETEHTMEQMFGAQFDAGARYTDNTRHFGESVK